VDDRVYSDADAVALYDVLNPWHPGDDFHLPPAMGSPSALDVGCGTGIVLKAARAAGHTGRLVVTSTETTSDDHGTPLRVDRTTLRFLDLAALAGLLEEAGFAIESQYGGWSHEPFRPGSPEIVTGATAC
jgi:hypothetical protein